MIKQLAACKYIVFVAIAFTYNVYVIYNFFFKL